MNQKTEQLKEVILENLDENKAEDIKLIKSSDISTLFDYMIIATGRSGRHAVSLAENLSRKIKKVSKIGLSIEGLQNAEWILIDAGALIVHIFQPEIRLKYNIEALWDTNYAKKTMG